MLFLLLPITDVFLYDSWSYFFSLWFLSAGDAGNCSFFLLLSFLSLVYGDDGLVRRVFGEPEDYLAVTVLCAP